MCLASVLKTCEKLNTAELLEQLLNNINISNTTGASPMLYNLLAWESSVSVFSE